MSSELTVELIKARARTFDVNTVFVLSLANCKLTTLSSHLALCTNLQILDVSHNQLTSLALLTPTAFPNLHTLHAHHNGLTSLDSLPLHPALRTVTFHHNKLTSAVEWREGWLAVDGKVKRASDDDDDSEADWQQYLATLQHDLATDIATRTRTAKPATLSLPLAAEASVALPAALVVKSNMDREKLRGMLDEWDELTTACNDAVSAACHKYSMAV